MASKHLVKKRAKPRATRPAGVQLGADSARALILRGAAEVFAKRGVRAASVQDILTAAGISRRTFYRFYESKEDVLVELYRLGTENLLSACRRAVQSSPDPLLQIQGCIDAHLHNARALGRLVFVLGGEAQRRESALHPRRMQVHEALVTLLLDHAKGKPQPTDPLLYRALILAVEGVTRWLLEVGDQGRHVSEEALARARSALRRIAVATLGGEGEGVARRPGAPRRSR